MKNKKFLVITVIFSLMTSGCNVRFNEEEADVNEKQDDGLKATNSTDNSYNNILSKLRLVPTKEPHIYEIDDSSIPDGFKITNDPADLSNGQLNTSLLNNSKKVISVYLTNSSSDEILAVGKLKVPRDLIVRNYDNLINWEKGEFNRVFLDSKNIIYTNGRTLNLETNTLIAFNRARIDTFKPSQKAGKGSKGRNGGVITIKAKKAIGEAYITLRGEQGGDGIEPPSQYNNPNYRGVKGPTGEPGEDGSAGRGEFSFCRKQPTNGGQGGKGKSGFKGQRGFPGGLSGSLLINVDDAREFQVTVSMEKSKGGAGSVGGRGGRGGEGGEPGRNNTSECKKASMGPEGPPGERGSRGEDGVFGKTEHYCLKLGSENAVICTE